MQPDVPFNPNMSVDADPIDEVPPDAETIQSEIDRLAALPSVQYEVCRSKEARRLGMRTSVLDQHVRTARKEDNGDGRQGRALELPEPEPWPEEVDGDDLLKEITRAVKRYVAIPEHGAEAVALWIIHAHALDAATVSPRLFLTSPSPRCGKTTLLEVIKKLVTRSVSVANISPAALFRTVEVAQPTLLIDEADSFARDNEDLRGILNSGHRKGGSVIRTVGDDHEPRQFSTWAATAIAGIGDLPQTIQDRSIVISLRRKHSDERVQRFRSDRTPELDRLARMVARWARDHVAALVDADPDLPETLHDRAADNWRALVAIADAAGGEWPGVGRSAAVALSGGEDTDGAAVEIQLLSDIRNVFERRDTDRVSTTDLLHELHSLEERPWLEWGRNRKPITARQFSMRLAPYGIASGTVRDGLETFKGYRRDAFDDAFSRYLPPLSVTPSQPAENREKSSFSIRHKLENVTDRNSQKPRNSRGCDSVTDRNPENGIEGLFSPDDESEKEVFKI